jgi:hypothetical protein
MTDDLPQHARKDCEREGCTAEGTARVGVRWMCEPDAEWLMKHGVYCCIEGIRDWPRPDCPGFWALSAQFFRPLVITPARQRITGYRIGGVVYDPADVTIILSDEPAANTCDRSSGGLCPAAQCPSCTRCLYHHGAECPAVAAFSRFP